MVGHGGGDGVSIVRGWGESYIADYCGEFAYHIFVGQMLHSGARKHYNVRSVLYEIFWNAHSVLCMSGAAR